MSPNAKKPVKKAARTKKRSTAVKKAASTRKHGPATKKAVATRKHRAAARKAVKPRAAKVAVEKPAVTRTIGKVEITEVEAAPQVPSAGQPAPETDK